MTNKEVELLLVEDSPNDAELTMRALRKNKLANTMVHVKDGAEALDFVFGSSGPDIENAPKAILLDLKLPKVSGLEVLERLKSDERTRSIPVIILTSSREDADLQRCYELGANSYIVKPVEFESFVKAVSEMGFYWLLLHETTR
jgi:two-component system response regulator